LKSALRETIDQNDLLRNKCTEMQRELDQKDLDLAAKDRAIVELAAALDVKIS
jgi:hypothetical protein